MRTLPIPYIVNVGIHLPENVLTVSEVEDKIISSSPSNGYMRKGFIKRLTGVEKVHRLPEDWQASDLAVAGVKDLVNRISVERGKVITFSDITPDLLIFASASQDMIEPATSHITAAKLGLTCPVMDVKNACNSVANAIEVAESFIQIGKYKRILIASGETPSRAIRWNIPDKETFLSSFPGFSMSDAGSAVLIEAATEETGNSAIIASAFTAHSEAWDVGMLPTGGSMYPRDIDKTYFHISGDKLFKAFNALGPDFLNTHIANNDYTWDDFNFIGVHQVSLPYLNTVKESLGLPHDKEVITLREHGNIASCSLPLQLRIAIDEGKIKRGDDYALVGLAGGISMGIIMGKW
jgi:3-oxoacyl-[acyl-carrier-protein] synthase III